MSTTMNWQDYRGKGEGVLVHLDTTKKHALPVRDPIDSDGELLLEPNYETSTFGLLQCYDARTRLATLKNRRRYVVFGTRYQGLLEAYRNRFFIIGYMRLDQMLEVRKKHSHKWMEKTTGEKPECIALEACYAFRSGEMHFYAIENGFELSEKLMKEWGYKGKITKQMKLTFTEEKLETILAHFKSKTPADAEFLSVGKEVEALVLADREQVKTKKEEVW